MVYYPYAESASKTKESFNQIFKNHCPFLISICRISQLLISCMGQVARNECIVLFRYCPDMTGMSEESGGCICVPVIEKLPGSPNSFFFFIKIDLAHCERQTPDFVPCNSHSHAGVQKHSFTGVLRDTAEETCWVTAKLIPGSSSYKRQLII